MHYIGYDRIYPSLCVVHCISYREFGSQPTGWDETPGSDVSEPDRGSACVCMFG